MVTMIGTCTGVSCLCFFQTWLPLIKSKLRTRYKPVMVMQRQGAGRQKLTFCDLAAWLQTQLQHLFLCEQALAGVDPVDLFSN